MVPARPLMCDAAKSSGAVGERGGADLEDDVSAREPRLLRRRALEHVLDEQPLGLDLDVDPDPAQMRVVLILERLVVGRVVVVRVLVVEARHGRREALVDEVGAADLAVVVVLNQAQDLVDELVVARLGDEGAADRPGQPTGMAAEPHADEQHDDAKEHQDKPGRTLTPRVHLRLSRVAGRPLCAGPAESARAELDAQEPA